MSGTFRVEEEESAKQKLQLERNQLESRVKTVEADLISQEDSNTKLSKDKKLLEEKLTETQVALAGEEDKSKNLTKVKNKQEQTIADLEGRIRREEQVCMTAQFCWLITDLCLGLFVSCVKI